MNTIYCQFAVKNHDAEQVVEFKNFLESHGIKLDEEEEKSRIIV